MDAQRTVSRFIEEQGLESPPAYRLLDLVSEVGELSKDAVESTGYGADPGELQVETDEVGDVLFSLLALAEAMDIDAEGALEVALAKYEDRLQAGETPSSGS